MNSGYNYGGCGCNSFSPTFGFNPFGCGGCNSCGCQSFPISSGCCNNSGFGCGGGSTWFAEKSTYSHTGFKFEFEDDGTFTITDNYRGSTARITGKGTWALTANVDSDQTHSSNFTDILGEDYYVIEIENFETTESKGYYVDIHLAIAKDGHALVYHFIPGSTVASTQYGNAKKIA